MLHSVGRKRRARRSLLGFKFQGRHFVVLRPATFLARLVPFNCGWLPMLNITTVHSAGERQRRRERERGEREKGGEERF